jgi:hypothetical protein
MFKGERLGMREMEGLLLLYAMHVESGDLNAMT